MNEFLLQSGYSSHSLVAHRIQSSSDRTTRNMLHSVLFKEFVIIFEFAKACFSIVFAIVLLKFSGNVSGRPRFRNSASRTRF